MDNKYGNLCPDKIESAIDKNTGGILATHNYGFPGELEKLELISKKYGIPLIYDGAPSIGLYMSLSGYVLYNVFLLF